MPEKGGKRQIGKPFKKGEHTAGRQPGTPNKFTNLKNDFLAAYEMIGGKAALAEWGKTHKREFFQLVAKMLPNNVNFGDGTPGSDTTLTVNIVHSSASQLEQARKKIKDQERDED